MRGASGTSSGRKRQTVPTDPTERDAPDQERGALVEIYISETMLDALRQAEKVQRGREQRARRKARSPHATEADDAAYWERSAERIEITVLRKVIERKIEQKIAQEKDRQVSSEHGVT